jgi:hypothetical protein
LDKGIQIMAAPNIVNVTSIIGKTAVQQVSTSVTQLMSNSISSNKVFKVNTLIISNVTESTVANITVEFNRSAVAYDIAKTVSIPANSTLVLLNKESSIYLEEGDSISLQASANNSLEAICSYEEIG